MTTTPGSTPGSSDSSEPDDGDSPTTPHPSTPSTASPAATTPRIPGPSAPVDAAPAHERPAAASPAQEQPVRPQAAAERNESEQNDSAADQPAVDESAQPQPEDEQHAAAGSLPGWARHQPPPATEGWARWTPPPGKQPPPPHQGGPRWGPTAGGTAGGQPQAGPGAGAGTGWQAQYPRWGVRAPDPKPGVVPLRPLGAGEILSGSIDTLRTHWRKVIGYTVVVGAVVEAASALLQHQFSDTSRLNDLENNPDATASDIVHALGGSLAASGLTLLVTMFASVIATALMATVVSRAVLGRQIGAAELRRDIRGRLPQLLGLAVLLPLITCLVVGVGALPGVLISVAGAKDAGSALALLGGIGGAVVMMWIFIQLSLTAPALMLEGQGVVASMKRSWKLVSGFWWRILGVQLLVLLVVTLVTALIGLPFMLVGDAVAGGSSSGLFDTSTTSSWSYIVIVAVGGTIGTALTLPITAASTTLLYLDQRIRRESLDIELIRAAREG